MSTDSIICFCLGLNGSLAQEELVPSPKQTDLDCVSNLNEREDQFILHIKKKSEY